MDDGARKKRKLALAQNLGDSKDAATDKDSTARKRERERILLARASVIKVRAPYHEMLAPVCILSG